MTSMKLLNVAAEFKRLGAKYASTVKENEHKTVTRMIDELREQTPVDTGLAQSSWKLVETGKVSNIINDTPYIEYLNQGSSKQAPAYFIESIAIKYGKPLGSIVTIIDN